MSLADWYHQKAAQSAQLAAAAADKAVRARFVFEQKAWLRLAKQIEIDERKSLFDWPPE